MKRIYIVSPTHIATGGTELLQQLCYSLNANGILAEMLYVEKYKNSEVEKNFREYNNPYVEKLKDGEENVIVIPETCIDVAKKFHRSIKYFWWLSVDNYYGSNREQYDFLHTLFYGIKDYFNNKMFRNSPHLVQSEYAFEYLSNEKNIHPNQIEYLSDYLNQEYLNAIGDNSEKRCDRVLYNPRKGFEFTSKIIAHSKEIEWYPLQGLSKNKMKEIMSTSKVYIDFGNHPGKDRIPREAAVCGCCVITGRSGAAKNGKDIPISEEYKFDKKLERIDEIIKKIKDCISNYEEKQVDFETYRYLIMQEQLVFEKKVVDIFGQYK